MSGHFQIFGKCFVVSRVTKELVSIELNYDPHPEFCCNILLETKIVQMQGQRENQCQAHHVKQSMS
jgi:hypothetical protein